ncbi:hypothetical protein EK0264_09400 [Epidermidibacterium keratini]|uniref:Uncharacterized protein n=1 Tax=Epidermidibacterium keratini TaxID=1891644 RepID=A0A7L4YNM9_9ACTN|nr:hypothetical protein [Epidermidibacterium keratini]QHC00474.1 hypothetical protein EK0264_09400 [Epidermidibacterium keratini]
MAENDPRRPGEPEDYGEYGAASDPGQQPKRSWKDRIFSNRTARFVGSGVPYSMTFDETHQGALAQAAQEFGWQVSDSDEQAEALLESAPFRHAGFRAGHVVRGRFDPFADRRAEGLPTGEWSFIAFDAVEDSRVGRTVGHCVTASPTMIELPRLRILPSRFSTAGSGQMAVYPTVDPIFDARFKLLAPNGEQELAILTDLLDDDVRSELCAGPDLDEIWTSGDHLLVGSAGPHSEDVLARHLGVLTRMLRALRGTG